MKNRYSICLLEWAVDKSISNELGLFLIINSLCNKEGYCWASNEYLAKLFNIDECTISRKIKKLEENGYITIKYNKSGTVITSRELRLTKKGTLPLTKPSMAVDEIVNGAVDENVKDNNIRNNNININMNKRSCRFFSENSDLNVIDLEQFYVNM